MTAPREGHPFHVGQRVECAPPDPFEWTICQSLGVDLPDIGKVLVVSELFLDQTDGDPMVLFYGWPLYSHDGHDGYAYTASDFRPLDEDNAADAIKRSIDRHFRDFLNAPAPVEGEDVE